MTNFRNNISLTLPFFSANRCYHIGTAQSVHSAIHRGLLKSRGLAFRGKSKPDPNDARELYKKKHKLPDFSSQSRRQEYHASPAYYKKYQQKKSDQPRWLGRGKVNKKFQKAHQSFNESTAYKTWKPQDMRTKSLRQTMKNDMDREEVLEKLQPKTSDDTSPSFKLVANEEPYHRHSRRYSFTENQISERPTRPESQGWGRSEMAQSFTAPEDLKTPSRKTISDLEFRKNKRSQSFNGRITIPTPKYTESEFRPSSLDQQESMENWENAEVNSSIQAVESYSHSARGPIAIPYTTAASEFLYGSSVVEAALRSSREPSRKFYKLYIYSGANRENHERDQVFEQLAESKGVKVERVDGDWIRNLDKMSDGRPHNGYILEASPLPRLPVTGLREVVAINRQYGKKHKQTLGFKVDVEEQSREDAAINGSSDLVLCGNISVRKQPLVLMLDHIVDPGNLGGIIRTGSFLGVAAIAISVQNSASISPVVLKASAGAAESMTLLSVRDPAEFLLNSKKAGWFIYAAVPPSSDKSSKKSQSISVDELGALDSTGTSPSILTVGGEGEGIRRVLRNKADLEIYVPGYQELGIDSLNVSVATGIICNAFRQIYQNKQIVSEKSRPVVCQTEDKQGDGKSCMQEQSDKLF